MAPSAPNKFPAAATGTTAVLNEGQYLAIGQFIASKNGKLNLGFLDNGNLVVKPKDGGAPKYYYVAQGLSGAAYITPYNWGGFAQLRVLDKHEKELWNSTSFMIFDAGEDGPVLGDPASLILQDNGDFVIKVKASKWSSTSMPSGTQTKTTSKLPAGVTLNAGDVLVAPGGHHYLRLNENGSLTLFYAGSSAWESGKSVSGAPTPSGSMGRIMVSAVLQSSGELWVVGRPSGLGPKEKSKPAYVVGRSSTRFQNATLEVLDDGYFAVTGEGELWSNKSP
ncbi:hypothetical protein QBC47DRAFT_418778 [Echria macrotheca]|uniref:Bulb-type lectin domain-containing protein n=1 Tax=Echria macrotheca TaxID=438768 RepID=A0AAJ0B142_9PEZI|nr:hypothetical protein QBC47DRAFT_418778 [Echria macrotheca]